jgi:N4-gp56 family major capsid protein
MAVDDFIPEIWSAELLSALRNSLVYGGSGIVNRNYEGLIQQRGDTVHITTISDPAVASYTEHSTTVSYSALTDTDTTLVVDQADYSSFKVGDIEKAQANADFVAEATANMAYGLADAIDEFIASTLYTAVNNPAGGNDLGAKTVDISDNTGYPLLVDLRTTLNRDNCPMQGRWVVIPPEMEGALLQDARFIDASASADGGAALRNGFIGRAAGFDIYVSNQTPDPTANTYAVIAGHPTACTFAQQITKTEALRLEGAFADGVRSLVVYGAKVVRPTCLAMASVTVQA